MNKFSEGLAKGCVVCLVFLCLFMFGSVAHAAHEIEMTNITSSTPFVAPMTTYAKCTGITVEWTAPSMGSDVLQGFIYKWNNSITPLDDTTGWASVDWRATPYNAVKDDLAALNSGDVLFLHVKTWYLDNATQLPTYSADFSYGPFLIDNKAPAGNISVVDASGNDITSTTSANINVKLSASSDTIKVYLNETSEILTSQQLTPFSVDATYPMADSTPRNVTLYAWFEDAAGNISTNPATDTFELLASISISLTATIDLASGGTQVFRVEGTTANYDWSITNQVPETTGTVAQFTGGFTGTNSVTVQALVKGTFNLHALPTAGGTALDSGTITVVQGYTLGDVDGNGAINVFDVIKIARASLGLNNTGTFIAAAADIDKNGTINVFDVIKAARLSLGLSI